MKLINYNTLLNNNTIFNELFLLAFLRINEKKKLLKYWQR